MIAPPRSNLPKRLRIMGKWWRVLRRRDLTARGLRGRAHMPSRRIEIATDLSEREAREVLIHEILHVVWPWRVVSDEVEERLVTAVADRLETVLHDNWRVE